MAINYLDELRKLSKDEQELLKKFASMRGERRGAFQMHSRKKEHQDQGLFGRMRDAFNF